MKSFHFLLAQYSKRFIPLVSVSAALLLSQGQAKAGLTYNIFETAGNVVAQTSGSLNLTGATSTGTNSGCGAPGFIYSDSAIIGTGPNASVMIYPISGPSAFNGSVFDMGSSSSGITTLISGGVGIGLDPSYTSGAPIVSSSTFNNKTLAGLGFTTTDLIGTWTLNGTSETIKVFIAPPSPSGAAVPGPLPLPLLGAGAAFGWSRRLRKRIDFPLSMPPQS